MFHAQRIASLDLPELAPYRTLRLPHEHREQGIFVAEGDKVVHRLLASALEIVSVLVPEHRLAEYEPALRTRREDILVFSVTEKRILEELIGFEMFQGDGRGESSGAAFAGGIASDHFSAPALRGGGWTDKCGECRRAGAKLRRV